MDASDGPPFLRRLHADLIAMARRDRMLYAIALATLAAGFAMQPITGRHPDWALFVKVFGKLCLFGGTLVLILLGLKLVWLGAVAGSRRPTRDLLRWIWAYCARDGILANTAHTLAIFIAFASGFAVLKGSIGLVSPFAWDVALMELDRAVHFGTLPHAWLEPVMARPALVSTINVLYNVWFFVQIGSIVAACCAVRAQALRHQYLMAYMLVWVVGGFLIASLVSSAGPVYYERLGFGETYAPLMERLRDIDANHYTLWALEVQEKLWAGFTGERAGTAGISAFPSMHLATATLFVLAARQIGRALFLASIAFWVVTMVGSVVLGWHYAVDGYAAAAVALVAWRVAGAYGRRAARNGALPAEAGV